MEYGDGVDFCVGLEADRKKRVRCYVGLCFLGHEDFQFKISAVVNVVLHHTRRSGDRILVGGEIFRTRPERPWDPPILVYNR
jgi:hypothetical protein